MKVETEIVEGFESLLYQHEGLTHTDIHKVIEKPTRDLAYAAALKLAKSKGLVVYPGRVLESGAIRDVLMKRSEVIHNEPLELPATKLFMKEGESQREVRYAVSYTYNGGTVYKQSWYPGYKVPPPVLQEGCELVPLGVGLDLNSRPPRATAKLRRKPGTFVGERV